jgi:hypothetical protein
MTGHAKGTIKQHFVPQFLLRYFANSQERLYAYNLVADKSFVTRVKDIGHQNHFLSVPALDGAHGAGDHFERFFQGYEGSASTALREINARRRLGLLQIIGPDERTSLSRFLAVQYLRTPAARTTAVQIAGIIKHALGLEVAKQNDFDITDSAVRRTVEEFATMSADEQLEAQVTGLLDPIFIDETASNLREHVWLVGISRADNPLYIADNPVALHGHVPQRGHGLGIKSYGVEVMCPLSSTMQLSLIERRFVRDAMPQVEASDGCLYEPLTRDNVLFQRWKQVTSAQQFVYCESDDFQDAKQIADSDHDLRDPDRPRVDGWAFGRRALPPRAK